MSIHCRGSRIRVCSLQSQLRSQVKTIIEGELIILGNSSVPPRANWFNRLGVKMCVTLQMCPDRLEQYSWSEILLIDDAPVR